MLHQYRRYRDPTAGSQLWVIPGRNVYLCLLKSCLSPGSLANKASTYSFRIAWSQNQKFIASSSTEMLQQRRLYFTVVLVCIRKGYNYIKIRCGVTSTCTQLSWVSSLWLSEINGHNNHSSIIDLKPLSPKRQPKFVDKGRWEPKALILEVFRLQTALL